MTNSEFHKTSNDVNEQLRDALMEALSSVDMSKFDDYEDDDESDIKTEAVIPSKEEPSEASQKTQNDDASPQRSADSTEESKVTSYSSDFPLKTVFTLFTMPIVIMLIIGVLLMILSNISSMVTTSSDEDAYAHIPAVHESSEQSAMFQPETEEISGELIASSTGHYIEYVDKNMVQFVVKSDDGIEYRVQTCLHTRSNPHTILRVRKTIEKNNGCAFYQISENERPHAVVFVERNESDDTISIFADIYIYDGDMTYLTAMSKNSFQISREPEYPAAIEELSDAEKDVRE